MLAVNESHRMKKESTVDMKATVSSISQAKLVRLIPTMKNKFMRSVACLVPSTVPAVSLTNVVESRIKLFNALIKPARASGVVPAASLMYNVCFGMSETVWTYQHQCFSQEGRLIPRCPALHGKNPRLWEFANTDPSRQKEVSLRTTVDMMKTWIL